MIAVWGMDATKYLKTRDNLLRLSMLAVAKRADEMDIELGERRAAQIANAVGKMLGG